MSEPFRIRPRTDLGFDPVVRSSTGSPRPKLGFEPWITFHQTGVGHLYGDPGDSIQEIQAIERWAASQNKPNEYNYVIAQDEDQDVWEYAGPYQAAHSGGENSQSVGVLFLNGNTEHVTPLQIKKFRWLVYVLKTFAVVSGNVIILPHDQMPGAQTSCPDNVVPESEHWRLREPWDPTPAPPPPPPPPPPPVVTPTVLQTVAIGGDGWWSIARRVYGNTNVKANADALAKANGNGTIKPGDIIAVPGKAVR